MAASNEKVASVPEEGTNEMKIAWLAMNIYTNSILCSDSSAVSLMLPKNFCALNTFYVNKSTIYRQKIKINIISSSLDNNTITF